jgi:hypothetical protein
MLLLLVRSVHLSIAIVVRPAGVLFVAFFLFLGYLFLLVKFWVEVLDFTALLFLLDVVEGVGDVLF